MLVYDWPAAILLSFLNQVDLIACLVNIETSGYGWVGLAKTNKRVIQTRAFVAFIKSIG